MQQRRENAPSLQQLVVAHKETLISANRVENEHRVRFWQSNTRVAMLVREIQLRRNSLVAQTGFLTSVKLLFSFFLFPSNLGDDLQIHGLVGLNAKDKFVRNGLFGRIQMIANFLKLDSNLRLSFLQSFSSLKKFFPPLRCL